jgi:hypothetical protein
MVEKKKKSFENHGNTKTKSFRIFISPDDDRTTHLQLAGGLGGFPRSRVLDADQQIVVQLAVADKNSTALVFFILHFFFFSH